MTGVSDATERARQLVVGFPRSSGRTNMEYAAPGSGRWMSDARDALQVLAAELETAREALIRCASDLVAAEKRVAELEADARLALEGLPDPMHPRFRRDECERLVSSQVLIANMAGEDDPGNVEASRAALIEETAP